MAQEPFEAVDKYLHDLYVGHDAELEATLAVSDAAELPAIQVAPAQGKLLMILALSVGAKRILEIGTLGGYSTIWLARGLTPDGTLTTLEFEPKHADVARKNLAAAGFADRVEVIVGPALESLKILNEPFDLIFIDADKNNYPGYLEHALRLSRPGTLIIGDNVVRNGTVIDETQTDEVIEGTRTFNRLLSGDLRVTATALQTVGAKGWDGFAIAYVN